MDRRSLLVRPKDDSNMVYNIDKIITNPRFMLLATGENVKVIPQPEKYYSYEARRISLDEFKKFERKTYK